MFGATGDQVTVLGYGAMELRRVEEAQAERLLNGVLDAGINFIDTAPDYGWSEDMIGKYIERFLTEKRDQKTGAETSKSSIDRQLLAKSGFL